MLNIGPQELILVLIIALVVVGPQRLPELGRTIGKAIREFRKIQDDVKDTIKFDLKDEAEPHVRRSRSPGTSMPEGNGEVAQTDVPAPTESPDVVPQTGSESAVDASSETEIDPESRAAE